VHNADYVLKPQKQISALCQKYDLPCLDLFPAYRERIGNSEKLFRDGVHLTTAGHQLTAELINAFLREKGLISGMRFDQRGDSSLR